MTTAIKSGDGARPKFGGRPKGAVNKTTAILKDAILTAATKAGGEEGMVGYLTNLAHCEPVAFAGLLGKVLPLQVANADDKPFQITTIELVAGCCIEDSKTNSDS